MCNEIHDRLCFKIKFSPVDLVNFYLDLYLMKWGHPPRAVKLKLIIAMRRLKLHVHDFFFFRRNLKITEVPKSQIQACHWHQYLYS